MGVYDEGVERLGDGPSTAETHWLQRLWPPLCEAGERAELGLNRDLAYAQLRGRLRSGLLVVIDYGHCMMDRSHLGYAHRLPGRCAVPARPGRHDRPHRARRRG